MTTSVFVYEFLSGGGVPHAEIADTATRELLQQGRAMRDAIVADLVQLPGIEVTCATVDDDRPVVAPQLRYVVAEPGQAARDVVRVQARSHDFVWVVAPESGGELAALAAAVPPEQWIGCDRAAIAIASSKSMTARHLAQAKVAATRPWRNGEPPSGHRWVVKPDDGAGTCATRVFDAFVDAEREWRTREETGQAAILEPWVEGDALSASMLCGATQAELLSINRQQIDIDATGNVTFGGVTIDAIDRTAPLGQALASLAHSAVQALPGLRGYVGIDIVASPQGPVVIEVNPRLTCAYVGLSQRLGRNLARDVLAVFQVEGTPHRNHA